jgi:putative hydrolase of the HAD superfamily
VLTRPRAVLLDLDGTILDHDAASRAGIMAAMESSGIVYDGDSATPVARWRELEAEHFQRYLIGELDFEEQRIIRSREFLATFGRVETDRAALLRWFDGYRESYERSWRAFGDVQPFLAGVAALEDAPAIAVVTNGDHEQQASKLVTLGLERLPLFASSTIGARKPDRAIFLRVCELVDVDPADAWFVGDNRAVDAVGAEDAGLHGIWLDRGGEADRRLQPVRAASLLDVLAWVEAA